MNYRMPDDPRRYQDLRTDETQRYHLRRDKQASVIDTYTVALPPYLNEPGLLAPTLEGALTTLARLRAEPFPSIYPSSVFMPFGVIIETSFETVSRDTAIQVALLEGGVDLTDADLERINRLPDLHQYGKAQERRVEALARALALSRGMPLPRGGFSIKVRTE